MIFREHNCLIPARIGLENEDSLGLETSKMTCEGSLHKLHYYTYCTCDMSCISYQHAFRVCFSEASIDFCVLSVSCDVIVDVHHWILILSAVTASVKDTTES